jgi:cytochrome c5
MKYGVVIIFVLLGLFASAAQAAIDLMSPELIRARTAPVGKVNIATPATAPTVVAAQTVVAAAGDVGKKIYEGKCVICHGSGLAGAPKFGDAAAWKSHIAKGLSVLFQHVRDGFNAMPPKGTCMECSDADLKAAINYMVGKGK